jgi:mono/diheme cytochrome c family protein
VSGSAARIAKRVGIVVLGLAAAGAAWVGCQVARFDASVEKVYDVAPPAITRSADPAVIARGKHLVESVGACASSHCHGADLAGGDPIVLGPLGTVVGANITMANLGLAYSDGEFARVIRDGIKRDGRTLRFMPAQDFAWLPDSDLTAIVSYLRVAPPVDKACQPSVIGVLGKVLDRRGKIIMDVARRIDHDKHETAPAPAPDAAYGAYLTRLCAGCHGEGFSGGPIPGAPPSLPTPLDLTPDATGLQGWTFADFEKLMRTAVRKNGKPLDPFMPVEAWRNFDDTEMHAIWAFLQSLPPKPFGGR